MGSPVFSRSLPGGPRESRVVSVYASVRPRGRLHADQALSGSHRLSLSELLSALDWTVFVVVTMDLCRCSRVWGDLYGDYGIGVERVY